VSVVEDKRVVEVSALEPQPQLAADVANSFAEQYIEYREDQATEATDVQEQEYADEISALDQQIADGREEARATSGNERQDLRSQEEGLLAQKASLSAQLELL
jgi:uncharacterized protein involved in exopolysaccharide biosynthesis